MDVAQNDRTGSRYLITDVRVTEGRVIGGLVTDFSIHGQFQLLMTELCAENSATFKNFERIVLYMFQELLHVVGPRRITPHSTNRKINNLLVIHHFYMAAKRRLFFIVK